MLEVIVAATLAHAGLAGTVVEKGTRRKLPGIEVSVPALESSALTDGEGHFSLEQLPAGEHEVVIAAPGYRRFATREKLTDGERLEVIYRIESDQGFARLEATVQGDRDRQELSHTRLSPAELTQTAGSQGDALKTVENLPGVARTSPIGGGPLVIRGSNPQDSGVFLDGHPIPMLYHFYALTSTFNSDLIGSIDYLPGNFGVEHGDFTGGIVDVKSRAPRDEFHGYVKTSLIDAGALLEGNLGVKGLTFAIAGRRSLVDLFLRSVNSDSFSFTNAPAYYDAQFRLDYRPPGSRHSFSLLALTSDDQLGVLLKRPSAADPNRSGDAFQENGFSQLRLRHGYHAGNFSLDTSALAGVTLFNTRYANRSDVKVNTVDFSLRSTATQRFSDGVAASLGIDLNQSRLRYRAKVPANGIPREGEPNPDQLRPDAPLVDQPLTTGRRNDLAAWSELRLRLFPGFTLTPGARVDAFTYTGQSSVDYAISPRVGARWELTEAFALKAGTGLYTQGSRDADMTRAFGNPDLRAQRAWQSSFGVEVRPIAGIFFSAEGFYKRLDRIPVRTEASIIVNGEPVPQNLDNAGIGRIYGAEFLLRKELTDRLFGWISYTLARSERRDRPGDPWRLFDFDQTHNLTAVLSYKLPDGWQIGGRFRLISGNLYTPVIGSRYLASTDSYLPIYAPTNSSRLPMFHQLDVRVDKTWAYDGWSLTVFLDLLNAYNHQSVEGIAYSYDYVNQTPVHGLPIIPSIGLKGEF